VIAWTTYFSWSGTVHLLDRHEIRVEAMKVTVEILHLQPLEFIEILGGDFEVERIAVLPDDLKSVHQNKRSDSKIINEIIHTSFFLLKMAAILRSHRLCIQ
jgi:hypothetical protein